VVVQLVAGLLIILFHVLQIVLTNDLNEQRREEVERVTGESRQIAAEVQKVAPDALSHRAEHSQAETEKLLVNYRRNIELRDRQLQWSSPALLMAVLFVGYGVYVFVRAVRAGRGGPVPEPG
jgi:type II secretory pathway component PulM